MPQSPPRHNAKQVEINRKAGQREYNQTKRRNQDFYNSGSWRKVRAWHVKRNPLCVMCKEEGRATPVDVVDHIIPIDQNGDRLSETNLQSLCHLHHNRKTEGDRAGQKSTK